MVKITIQINDEQMVALDIREARQVYEELKELFEVKNLIQWPVEFPKVTYGPCESR